MIVYHDPERNIKITVRDLDSNQVKKRKWIKICDGLYIEESKNNKKGEIMQTYKEKLINEIRKLGLELAISGVVEELNDIYDVENLEDEWTQVGEGLYIKKDKSAILVTEEGRTFIAKRKE